MVKEERGFYNRGRRRKRSREEKKRKEEIATVK